MSKLNPNWLLSRLNQAIREVTENREVFCKDPSRDFIRDRKLPPEKLVNAIIRMGAKSTNSELIELFRKLKELPTKSAFTQQREKISDQAFPAILSTFIDTLTPQRLYRGMRVLACDGSDVNIPKNVDDPDTHIIQQNKSGYNQIHVNALYDILNSIYIDISIQGSHKKHERLAMNEMVDRMRHPEDSLVIADRGYESFNVFAHCIESCLRFLIRMKDIDSNGILGNYELPDEEFDTIIHQKITKRHTTETIGNPNEYTILSPYTDFDFFSDEKDSYEIEFRVVRFKVDDSYVCVATNLDDSFSLEDIKELYHLRWNEENSFRDLKYAIGMVYFHSKKLPLIIQEVYASIILYNFSAAVITAEPVQNKNTNHRYKINFSNAVTAVRMFLKKLIRAGDLTEIIRRNLTPIRDGRSFERNVKPKSVMPFINRPA